MNDGIVITTSIDPEEWDHFVNNHPYGNIFQTKEMFEISTHTKRRSPFFLAAIDENGQILSLVQSIIVKERNDFIGDFSARAIIHGGPLFRNDPKGKDSTKLLLNKYDEIMRKKTLYSEIRMLSDIPQFNDIVSKNEYLFEEHFNAQIDLENRSLDDVWRNIKRDKQRGIKKAQDAGVTIEECNEKAKVAIAYELISETYTNAKIPLADRSLFESTFDILNPQKKVLFLFAKYEGQYIATQIVLLFKGTIHAWYTGSKRNYLSLHPGDLLIWFLLKWGIENGYSKFDFGGGGSKLKNINLREYKTRFGTHFPMYGRYKKVYSPNKLKFVESGFKLYGKLRK